MCVSVQARPIARERATADANETTRADSGSPPIEDETAAIRWESAMPDSAAPSTPHAVDVEDVDVDAVEVETLDAVDVEDEDEVEPPLWSRPTSTRWRTSTRSTWSGRKRASSGSSPRAPIHGPGYSCRNRVACHVDADQGLRSAPILTPETLEPATSAPGISPVARAVDGTPISVADSSRGTLVAE